MNLKELKLGATYRTAQGIRSLTSFNIDFHVEKTYIRLTVTGQMKLLREYAYSNVTLFDVQLPFETDTSRTEIRGLVQQLTTLIEEYLSRHGLLQSEQTADLLAGPASAADQGCPVDTPSGAACTAGSPESSSGQDSPHSLLDSGAEQPVGHPSPECTQPETTGTELPKGVLQWMSRRNS